MVDEAAELLEISHHEDDDGIAELDLLGDAFTDELDSSNLESIFDDPLPSLNSPLTSPPRSSNSSVGSVETVQKRNSGSSAASLGLPGNELVEKDWRNEAFDLRYRKDVLLQIVKILHARKQNPPNEWLKSLPTKARKLEDQLYMGAPSLDDYRDKRTLKHRLKRVARAINAKLRASNKNRSSPNRSSPTKRCATTTSTSSTPSSGLHSLQSLVKEQKTASRRSAPSSLLSELASLQSLVNEQQHRTPSRRPSATSITPSELASLQASMATPPDHPIRRRGSNVITPHNNSTQPSIASELASLQAMNNQRQQRRSSITATRNNNSELLQLMNNTDGHIHPGRIPNNGRRNSLPSNNYTSNRQHFQSNNNGRQHPGQPTESREEQQAANQKLQEQILDNIRQQQQLMQELMVGKNQLTRSNGTNSNNNSRMPVMLNIANPSPKNNNNNNMAMLMNGSSSSKSNNDIVMRRNHHHHRRQLPMDLLQQSLTRSSDATSRSMSSMQQQQRNNNYHPSMLPPPRGNNNARRHSLKHNHHMSPKDFRW